MVPESGLVTLGMFGPSEVNIKAVPHIKKINEKTIKYNNSIYLPRVGLFPWFNIIFLQLFI
jgi:hypothetical protein